MRPGASAMSDIVLNLDISLDDPESAERHARAVLVRNGVIDKSLTLAE